MKGVTDILKSIKNENNIRFISAFLIGVLFTILFYSYLYNNKMKIDLSVNENLENNKVIAKVNNFKIYFSDISSTLSQGKKKLEDLTKDEVINIIKKTAIQKELLNKALKYNSYKEYSSFLQSFAINEVKENYIKKISAKSISENKIKEKYEEIISQVKGKKEYSVSHILAENKKDIQIAKNKLNSQSFSNVAKKLSIDKQTAERGGEIGYLVEGSLIKKFEEEMLQLKKNSISKPFKTNIGWHIIKLNDIRDVVVPEYNDIKSNIKKILIQQERQNILSDIENNLKINIY